MTGENKVEEIEVVKTDPKGDYEHREKIVEDIGTARRQNIQRVVQFVWLVFGVLEAFIGLRFFLQLIAANPANPFTRLVYDFTNLFMWPFAGLVNSPSAGGMKLEIPAVVAMLIYGLAAWVLVNLIKILFTRATARNVSIYERRRQ